MNGQVEGITTSVFSPSTSPYTPIYEPVCQPRCRRGMPRPRGAQHTQHDVAVLLIVLTPLNSPYSEFYRRLTANIGTQSSNR